MSFINIEPTYNFLIKEENTTLREYVRDFNQPSGFAWTSDSEIFTILEGVNDESLSSPNAFALILRACQSIFKGVTTIESFKQ
jgi:hypothetical protein